MKKKPPKPNQVISWSFDQTSGDSIDLESLIKLIQKHHSKKIVVKYGETITVKVKL